MGGIAAASGKFVVMGDATTATTSGISLDFWSSCVREPTLSWATASGEASRKTPCAWHSISNPALTRIGPTVSFTARLGIFTAASVVS